MNVDHRASFHVAGVERMLTRDPSISVSIGLCSKTLDFGFRVWGFRIWGPGFWVFSSRVSGLGFWVKVFGE